MLISQLSRTYSTWVVLKMDLHQECEHQIWGKTQEQAVGIHCSKKQYTVNAVVNAWTLSTQKKLEHKRLESAVS